MTKRRLLRWSLLLAVLAAFAVWLEPTRVVWGWLRGEAFYQGRPTSYWRYEFERWQLTVGYGRDATGKEHRTEHWLRDSELVEARLGIEARRSCTWPNPNSDCVDPKALAVLQELMVLPDQIDERSHRVHKLASYWMKIIDNSDDDNPDALP